jgi:hypothetical protein
VEVRIGIHNTARELSLETSKSVAELQQLIEAALGSEGSVLSLSDDKGKTVLIPSRQLAYVELSGAGARKVGFAKTA